MNFSLTKDCRLTTMLAVSLVLLAGSCHVTQANSPFAPHRQKRGYAFSDIFNDVKDTFTNLFGSDTTTTTTTTTPHPTTTTTTLSPTAASMGKLNDSQCRAMLTECGLVDVDSQKYRDSEKEVIVKAEVDRVREQYRVALEEVKKAMVFLIDITIKDPSMLSLSLLCDAVKLGEGSADETTTAAPGKGDVITSARVGTTSIPTPSSTSTTTVATKGQPSASISSTNSPDSMTTTMSAPPPAITEETTPERPFDDGSPTSAGTDSETPLSPSNPAMTTTTTTPKPTTPMPTTTLAPRCTVSEWSSWSAPLGFGTQERVRVILQPGYECPEQLKEYRNFTVTTTASPEGITRETPGNPVDNTDLVSDNFGNDFIRPSEGKPRDLLLILDSSGSIDFEEFAAIRSGVKVLIDSLCGGFGPAPEQNRLAIVQYSSTTRSVLSFSPRHQSPAVLKYSVDNLWPMYGYTCTGDALNLGYLNFQEKYGARNYSVHDTLIITDGQSNCGANLLNASMTLQQRSNVYALAIGMSSDEAAAQEITSLVSNRNPRHLFSLANFNDFKVMAEKVRAKHQANKCIPIVSNATTTSTN